MKRVITEDFAKVTQANENMFATVLYDDGICSELVFLPKLWEDNYCHVSNREIIDNLYNRNGELERYVDYL